MFDGGIQKLTKITQVEVFRKQARHHQPIDTSDQPKTLIALVSDVPLDLGVPHIDINDFKALADLIEKRFLKKSVSEQQVGLSACHFGEGGNPAGLFPDARFRGSDN